VAAPCAAAALNPGRGAFAAPPANEGGCPFPERAGAKAATDAFPARAGARAAVPETGPGRLRGLRPLGADILVRDLQLPTPSQAPGMRLRKMNY